MDDKAGVRPCSGAGTTNCGGGLENIVAPVGRRGLVRRRTDAIGCKLRHGLGIQFFISTVPSPDRPFPIILQLLCLPLCHVSKMTLNRHRNPNDRIAPFRGVYASLSRYGLYDGGALAG
jgi:hypothetical protein